MPEIAIAPLEMPRSAQDTLLASFGTVQINAARYIAMGHTPAMVAERVGVHERTVIRWLDKGLRAAVDILAARGWERLDAALWRNVELAMDVQQRVMTGEVGYNDGRAKEARWILERAIRRIPVAVADEPGIPPEWDADGAAVDVTPTD